MLTHASLPPPLSDLLLYLPRVTFTFTFTFAIKAGTGVTTEAETAMDPKGAVAAVGAMEALVGRPAGRLMYAYIDGLEECFIASFSCLLQGQPSATNFLFPICLAVMPCFLATMEAEATREEAVGTEAAGDKPTGAEGAGGAVGGAVGGK